MDNNTNTESNPNESNLDSILDDALEDFNKPIPPKKSADPSSNAAPPNPNVWTEEFISSATQNFESTMKSILSQQTDSVEEPCDESANSLDLGAMSAEFAKFAEAAAKAATDSSTDKDFTKCLADTIQQMAKNQEEAQATPSTEELSKMFEDFGLGDMGSSGEGNELGGLFPMMQTMLENILSKDILYPPLKEIVAKYPDWLADNRSSLSEEDYKRYNEQYDVMKKVVDEFEKDGDDSQEGKTQTSDSILVLMQKLQELGQPPQDLVGDFVPLMGGVDAKANSQLPDLSSLLGGTGFPCFGLSDANAAPNQANPTQANNSVPGDPNEQCVMM